MVKSPELQTRSDPSANRNSNNSRQGANTEGLLPKSKPFSKNVTKPASPSETEYGLCQCSPSSDISFGWQEVPIHTHTSFRRSSYESEGTHTPNSITSEWTSSDEQIDVTTQDSNSNELVEAKGERNFCVTETSNESNFREDKERETESTHLALKSIVSENLGSSNFIKNKTHNGVMSVNVGNSEELAYPQKLTGKLAKYSYEMKKTGVPVREESGSDNSDDSVEMPSLLKDEEYGLVKVRTGLEIENLTEEEEIWMVQCPISLNPQDLENEELVFGGTSAFMLKLKDLEKYEITSYVGRNKPVSCLLPSREKGSLKAKVLQPEGLIVIMEKIDVPEVKMTCSEESNIQTPEGLRIRHPLFGYDYKEELEVRTGFTSQHRRMKQEDLPIQPKRTKKDKKKKGSDVYMPYDRGLVEKEQECHYDMDKTKKSKKYNKEHQKRKKDKK